MSLFVQPSLGFIVFVCFGVLVSCEVFHSHDFLGWSRNRNAGPLNVHISVCFLLPCMYEFHCVRVYVLVCLPMSPYLVLFPLITPLPVYHPSARLSFPLPVYHPFACLSSLCPFIIPLPVYHPFARYHPFACYHPFARIIPLPFYHPFTRLSSLCSFIIPLPVIILLPVIIHLRVNHAFVRLSSLCL